MANAVLGFRNWLTPDPAYATVATTGGLWLPDLPFANAIRPGLAEIARSADANPQHTRRWLDLGTTRDTRLVAFVAPKASRLARFRARCFETWQDEGSTLLGDTGWIELYPVIYPVGTLPTWHVSFVDGRLAEEEASLYPVHLYHVFQASVVGRYWLIEIDDGGGGSAHVDLPYVMLTPGWQLGINMAYGASLGWEDRSIAEESWGGAEYFEVLDGRRVVRFQIDRMADDEALAWGFDLMRRQGTHGEVFFAWDPDDVAHRHRRAFYGRLRRLSPVEAAAFGFSSLSFEIAEII